MGKYYVLGNDTWATDFQAALENYYGDGVSVHYASGNIIIFTCPQVCDKVVKIEANSGMFKVYVGSSYSSGANINDSVTVNKDGYNTDTFLNYEVVLSEKFVLARLVKTGTAGTYTALLFKSTNGKSFIVCGQGSDNDYANKSKCFATDTMTTNPIRFLAPQANAYRSGAKLVLLKSYFARNAEMELNDDGTFAYVDGLYLTCEAKAGASIVGENYFISTGGVIRGGSADRIYCATGFFVELEPAATV